MWFLVEKFGARPFVFAQLLVQRDRAGRCIGLVAGSGFDVAFKGGDLVRDRNSQFPIEPVNQQICLRQFDGELAGDRFEWRLVEVCDRGAPTTS